MVTALHDDLARVAHGDRAGELAAAWAALRFDEIDEGLDGGLVENQFESPQLKPSCSHRRICSL